MQRRKFLIGTGSLAAGSAAAMGSGAFTSVSAERTVNVSVADDANAFLAIDDIDSSPNSEYVDTTGDQVILNLDETSNGGSGFNAGAETRIDNVLQVTNQGTQTVNIWVTLDAAEGDTFDDDTLYFYPGDAKDTALNNGEGDSDGDDVLRLTPGEGADLGVLVDLEAASSSSEGESPTATVHASVTQGASDESEQVNDSGGGVVTVSANGTGDYSSIQAAENAVDAGATILVNGGTYNEGITIDTEDVTLKAAIGASPTVEFTQDEISVGGEPAIEVTANGARVEGMTVDLKDIAGEVPSGIHLAGDDTVATGNTVNLADAAAPGGQTFIAGGGDSVEISDNTLDNAIVAYWGSGDATVTSNTLSGEVLAEAFWSTTGGSLTVESNDFSQVTTDADSSGEEDVKFTDSAVTVNQADAGDKIATAVIDDNTGVDSVKVAGDVFTS